MRAEDSILKIFFLCCCISFFFILSAFAQSCSCTSPTGSELVVNGNFSAGNTGFTSQYSSLCTPGGMFSQVDVYCVGTNPSTYNAGFSSCSGNGGSGNFMIVNGGNTLGSVVWTETITVTPTTNYVFSTWIVSTATQSPGQLQFYINGVALAGTIQAPSNTCNWVQFCKIWNSGASTTATIQIKNINTAAFGNDYGLDDISFVACACTGTMTVSVTSANATCGSINGSATVNPSGGISPYIYLWSNSQTTQTATGLGGGSYTATVTDDNGCSKTATTVVNTTPGPTATISPTSPSCNGGSNGTAAAAGAGGSSPYSFSWNTTPAQTSQTATGLSAVTYTVIITDASGCIGTQSVTLTQPSPITASTSVSAATCGSTNGSATASTSGGTGSFTYNWNPSSQTTQTATGLAAGTYNVTVTDANGCTQTVTTVVATTGGPTVNFSSTTSPSCNGGSNGSATAAAAGGSSPYTYSWSTTPAQTSQTATGLSVGNYTVTVTDNNGCSNTATVVITQPAVLTVTTACTGESVAGANDGASSASPFGGTPPYSYLWSNSQTTQNISSLPPNNYTVSVTANGCTATSACTVNAAVPSTCPTCQLPGWQYVKAITIDNSAISNSYTNFQELIIINTVTPISQGKMNALGNDIRFVDSNCSTPLCYYIENGINTATTKIWVLLPSLAANAIKTIYMFYGNTAATAQSSFSCVFPNVLTVTGAVTLSGNQNYDWIDIQSGSSVTIGAGQILFFKARKIIMAGTINGNFAGYGGAAGPGAGCNGGGGQGGSGGSYGGVGGTGGGCGSPPAYGTANGTDIDMGSGGGGSDCAPTGGGGGAVKFEAAYIDLTGSISVNGWTTPGSCNEEAAGGGSGGGILVQADYVNGNSSLSAIGGNGQNSQNKEGGGGGAGGRIKLFYCKENNFSGTTNVNGGQIGSGPQPGETAGSVGTSTINTFACETITAGNEQFITVANAGTDAAFCSGSSATIGSAALSNYTYSWLPTTGLSNATISNPTVIISNTGTSNIVTNYIVSASSNGCTKTDTVQVTVYPLPTSTFTATGPVCVSESIAITYTGNASSAATYIWNFDSGTIISGSGQGPYVVSWPVSGTKNITLTVLQNGCLSSTTTVIATVNPPDANAGADKSVCSLDSTAIGAPPTAGFTYSWSPTTGLSSSTAANPQVALVNATSSPVSLNYIVTTSFAGCTVVDTVAITVMPALVSNAGTDKNYCTGGSAIIGTSSVSGYTYSWSPANGLSDTTVSNPVASLPNTTNNPVIINYVVTTTYFGCPLSDTVAVTINPIPVSNAGPDTNYCSGNSTIIGTGATPSYLYSWSPSSGLSSSIVSNPTASLANATASPVIIIYVVTTTYFGCPVADTVAVTINPAPVSFAGSDVNYCSGDSASLGTSVVIGGYSYSWSPATGLSNSTISNPVVSLPNITTTPINTNYIVTTTYFNCPVNDTVAVTINPLPVSNAGPDMSYCSGNTAVIGTASSSGYSYSWSPASGLNNISISNPSTLLQTNTSFVPDTVVYIVTTVYYGCSVKDSMLRIIFPAPISNAGTDTALCSGNQAQLGTTNTPNYSYLWSPANGLSSATVSNPTLTLPHTGQTPLFTTYIVTTTFTAYSCTSNDSVNVTVFQVPTSTFSLADTTVCEKQNNTITYTGNASSSATYSWDFGGGVASPGIGAGPHNVVWTSVGTVNITLSVSENSCTSSVSSKSVIVKPYPASVAGNDTNFCSGATVPIGANPLALHSYLWTPATGLSSTTAARPTVSVTDSTSNIQILTYYLTTTLNGCSSTDTVQVTVYPIPIANFTPPAGQCIKNNSFSFFGGGTFLPAAAFQWNFGGGAAPASSTLQNDSVSFSSTGKQVVTFTIIQYGCTSAVKTDTVQLYEMPIVSYTLSPATGCQPLTVSFKDNTNNVAVSSWQWNFGDGSASAIQNSSQSHTYTLDGKFNISLTVKSVNGCESTDTLKTITVYPKPESLFEINPTQITNLNPVAKFTDKSFASITGWLWKFSDGQTSDLQNPEHQFSDTGRYCITLIVTNTDGCSDTTEQCLRVLPDYILNTPNAFSPNGDGVNDMFIPKGIGVDPNQFEMLIFNRWGELIYQTNNIANPWNGILESGTPAEIGIYVWSVVLRDVSRKEYKYFGHVTLVR